MGSQRYYALCCSQTQLSIFSVSHWCRLVIEAWSNFFIIIFVYEGVILFYFTVTLCSEIVPTTLRHFAPHHRPIG